MTYLTSESASKFSGNTYDFIVLGAGTAGFTLAGRLSSLLPHLRIAVLERGHDETRNPLIASPGTFGQALATDLNWGYSTVPQKHCNNRILELAAGKTLGGTSAVNFLIWHAGCEAEYDVWEQLGNKGWNGKEMQRVIRKVEGFVDNEEEEGPKSYLPVLRDGEGVNGRRVRKERHGHDGPLTTGFSGWYPPQTTKAIQPAFEKCGVPYNPDPMGGANEGMTFTVGNIDPKTYTRTTSATVFEKLQTGNVDVMTGVMVKRVVLEDVDGEETPVATGVEFLDEQGQSFTVKLNAGGEVIVSGGYIQSPKILELSGIGKREVLEAAGVSVKVENPNVGENLQDHQFFHLSFEHKAGETTRDRVAQDPELEAEQKKLYETSKKGFYTTCGTPVAIMSMHKFMSEDEISELARIHSVPTIPGRPDTDPFLTNALPRPDVPPTPHLEILMPPWKISTLFDAEPGKTYTTFTPVLMHPMGRGSTHIKSSDPLEKPAVDLNFYSHPLDKAVMVAAAKFAAKVTQTEPLTGCLQQRKAPREGPLSDEEWWEHIKNETHSAQHAIASCSMLPRDKGGVVDDRARVYGVKGLRVCDASIAPSHFSAHSQATTFGIAEMVAERITEDWGVKA